MARERNKIIYILISLLLLIVSVIGGRAILPAFADTVTYSNVLDDLQKDSSFNANDYPDNPNDYSIKVIQIAESENDELFIYTYQPCQRSKYLVATDINMTFSESVSSTRLYGLGLISCSGVFAKYLVKTVDVSIRKSDVRYYNITSIYRAYDKEIDKGASLGNTVTAVAFDVGQLWTACNYNGGVTYTNTETETITVTSKVVGTVRYFNGLSWFTSSSCDSHFVAFSTDRRIDKLQSAELYFVTQAYNKSILGTTLGDPEEHNGYVLTDNEVASNVVNGIFARSYTWKRIQTVKEFLNSGIEFSVDLTQELSTKQFVLNFYETDFTTGLGGLTPILTGLAGILIGSQASSGTLVSDVSILRLKFETDGIVYNLGVVDNKQTGSSTPIAGVAADVPWWFWVVLGVVVLVLVVIVVCVVCPAVLPLFRIAFTSILSLITLPFRAIGDLFSRRREEKITKPAVKKSAKKNVKKKRKTAAKKAGKKK